MPVIQQQGAQRSVKGLPIRWGLKAYRELRQAKQEPERYSVLAGLLDEIVAAPVALDTTDAQIVLKASQFADECQRQAEQVQDKEAIRRRCIWLCHKRGIKPPEAEKFKPFFARVSDPAWWRKQLRTIHGRRFEYAAIRLGFVSNFAGAYASDETVARRIEQNKRNKKILEQTYLENENAQQFKLSELAAKGTANKSIRRGELMLRMRGLEEIATECGHIGLFVTLTCPSKYHAIRWGSGTTNPNYNGATPREAQAYLQGVWACIRAKLHRNACKPYGFRIAEPHHDACPHWHMLLFVAPEQAALLESVMQEYALAEDGDEAGAAKNRIKIVRIEASKGTAAGYIAKYIGKNIDGEHVTEHDQQDGLTVTQDLIGDQVIQPAQRVEAWAGTWGIRQFQAIGCPPITVWREMRRVGVERIQKAPAYIKQAWAAAQKIDGSKQADFAEYIRAQGGINQGRKYRIGVAQRLTEIEGRYGLEQGKQPCGIYSKLNPKAIYESTRYRWKRGGRAVEVAFPWTRVNNCTQPAWLEYAKQGEKPEEIEEADWYESSEFRQIELSQDEIEEMKQQAMQEAIEVRKKTVFTKPKRGTSGRTSGRASDFFGAF